MKNVPTAREKLILHYELMAQAQEKIRAIAIRRLPETEEELIGLVPQKFRILGIITHVWKDITKNRPPQNYSLSPFEKSQVKFKHFGIHQNSKLYPHLPPIPDHA